VYFISKKSDSYNPLLLSSRIQSIVDGCDGLHAFVGGEDEEGVRVEGIRKKWMQYEGMGLGPDDFRGVVVPKNPNSGGRRDVYIGLDDDVVVGSGGVVEGEEGILPQEVPQPPQESLFPPSQPLPPQPTGLLCKVTIDEDYKISVKDNVSTFSLDGIVKLLVAEEGQRKEEQEEEGEEDQIQTHKLRVALDGRFNRILANGPGLPGGGFSIACQSRKPMSAIKYHVDEAVNVVRVQSRLAFDGATCRVSVQVATNPAFSYAFTSVTVGLNLPPVFKRDTLRIAPGATGGWINEATVQLRIDGDVKAGEKRVVRMQAVMEQAGEGRRIMERTAPPVFVRMYANENLTNAQVTVESADGAEVGIGEVVRRLRIQVNRN
jgi:hypothetical protein